MLASSIERIAEYTGPIRLTRHCESAVVDVHHVRRRRGEFAAIGCGVYTRAMSDHVCAWAAASPARYRASSSSKAASMSSRSNTTSAANPLVGVDLDDVEHLGVERVGPLVSSREAGTREGEALAAGRNDGRRHVRDTRRRRSPARSRSAASRPCRTPAFTTRRRSSTERSSASVSAIASQSRAAK